MKNKNSMMIRVIICVAIAVTMLAGPLALPGQAAEKVINLKFSSFLSPGHPATKVLQEFVKELSETSNGKVAVKFYGAGALGKAAEQYDVVVEGLADMALTCCGFAPSRFPLSLGVQLPFFSDSAQTGAKILIEFQKRGLMDSEFEDVVYLFPTTTTPSQIFSNKKITNVLDLKGLRIWGGESVFKEVCDILGATAIVMSTPDVYLALQRKTVDAAINSWTSGVAGWKWNEVAKYAIDVSIMSGWHCNVVMNKKSWNKIPKEVQGKWKELFPKYTMKIAAVFDNVDAAMRGKLQKAPGIELSVFPQAERLKLAKSLIPVWQKWVDSNGKKGREMYKVYVEIMKKIGKPVLVKLPGLYQE
jgi:TRAP-type C4-dicarboxylate transport system substrate-binding protein